MKRYYCYYAPTLSGIVVNVEREDFRKMLARSKYVKKDEWGMISLYDKNWNQLAWADCYKM